MPTFIDESGDTGPIDGGGKTYFRLAGVWVGTHDEANEFRDAVRKLRKELGVKASFEFKFFSTANHPERRTAFFELATRFQFRFCVSAIDKRAAAWTKADKDLIYRVTANDLAATFRECYRRAESGRDSPLREPIIVDDNSDKKSFLPAVQTAFRGLTSVRKAGTSLVGKVSFRVSGPDEMLQLADMVCGAFGDALEGNGEWLHLIGGHWVGSPIRSVLNSEGGRP